MPKKGSVHHFALKHGLIVAVIPNVYNTILVLFDLLDDYYGDAPGGEMKLKTYIFILPLCIGIAIYSYKKSSHGFLKIKEAIFIGLEIAMIASVIMIGFHLLFNSILAPSFHEIYYEQNGQQIYKELVECCEYTREQYLQHKNQRIYYGKNGQGYFGDFLTAVLIGLIFSTIIGLIMKKNTTKTNP